MSERASLPTDRRRARPALVIDGEATVLDRKAAPHGMPAAPRPTDETPARASRVPLPETPARTAFGRRPAGPRTAAHDLFFQGPARARPASAARRGLSVFTDAAIFARAPHDRRMAGLAAVLALLALPVLILSAPIAPAEATPGAVLSGAEALVIDQIATSIVPRGTGAVLIVDARIRNPSAHMATVPPVRIALADADGGVRSKSLATGLSSLAAGRSLRFHSAVAVAKDTRGDVEVGFLMPPGPSGKTLIE